MGCVKGPGGGVREVVVGGGCARRGPHVIVERELCARWARVSVSGAAAAYLSGARAQTYVLAVEHRLQRVV